MWILPRNTRVHVPSERLQDRYARGNIPDVDFEYPRHRIGDPDPRQILRFDLPRRRRPRDGDSAGDDAETHETAQRDFALKFDVQVSKKDDGESGADEVCDEGEDALSDEDVHDCLFGHAFSGNAEVPDFVHGDALEDFEEEEGEVGDYEEGD